MPYRRPAPSSSQKTCENWRVSVEEIHADKSHVVLDGGHFQLVVHNIPKKIADSIEITDPPRIRKSVPIKICLPVPGIESARKLASALGGKIGAKENRVAGAWLYRVRRA